MSVSVVPAGAPDPAPAASPPGAGPVRPAAGVTPVLGFVGRVLALLLLPLSIAPVLLLGPSVLRAPVALAHEGWGDVQRLERQLDPERPYRPPPAPTPGPSVWQARISLGQIYGRWSGLPGAGRAGITWTGAR